MISHRQFFGDAEHTFTLGPDQLVELERVTGLGTGALCQRVFAGSFHFDQIRQTIRLALIGGGLDPQEAAGLVKAYVDPAPIARAMMLAVAILNAVYFGEGHTGDTGPIPEETGDLDSEALA